MNTLTTVTGVAGKHHTMRMKSVSGVVTRMSQTTIMINTVGRYTTERLRTQERIGNMESCVLIDNFRQEGRLFQSVADLKRYAKKHNLQIKENKDNLSSLRSFYTE